MTTDQTPGRLERRSDRLFARLERHPRRVFIAIAVAYSPLLFLGYGTDIDRFGVRLAASAIRQGSYTASRPPGSLVHEAITAVTDPMGPAVSNAATLGAAAVSLAMIVRLLRRDGSRNAVAGALVVAANPYFVIAATSLADHVWTIALLLLGADAAQRRRPASAGLWWGLAIGSRLSSVVTVAGLVAATLFHRGVEDPVKDRRKSVLVASAVAIVVGISCFVPAWLEYGTRDFMRSDFEFRGWLNTGGRWLIKHELIVGIPAALILVSSIRVVRSSLSRWSESHMLKMAVFGAIGAEVVFFRFPWKVAHLLPVLVLGILILASSPRFRPRLAVALIIGQLLWGAAAVRTLVPDTPNEAGGGHLRPAVVVGPLWNDIRCRIERVNANASEDLYAEAVSDWLCSNSWWSDGPELPAAEQGQ